MHACSLHSFKLKVAEFRLENIKWISVFCHFSIQSNRRSPWIYSARNWTSRFLIANKLRLTKCKAPFSNNCVTVSLGSLEWISNKTVRISMRSTDFYHVLDHIAWYLYQLSWTTFIFIAIKLSPIAVRLAILKFCICSDATSQMIVVPVSRFLKSLL